MKKNILIIILILLIPLVAIIVWLSKPQQKVIKQDKQPSLRQLEIQADENFIKKCNEKDGLVTRSIWNGAINGCELIK